MLLSLVIVILFLSFFVVVGVTMATLQYSYTLAGTLQTNVEINSNGTVLSINW